MSVTFTITGKKKLFGDADVLTIGEALKLSGQELEQYSFDAEKIEDFYQAGLDQPECLLVGVEGESMRGFELSCEEDSNQYHIRVFTPSTIEDWQIAIAYMQALARHFHSDIVSEHGESFTVDTIIDYPYIADIEYGIKAMQGHDSYQIFGLYRPVSFDQEMLQELADAEFPAVTFGEMTTFIQYLNAYSARQKFYSRQDEDGSEIIIGSYTLTEDVDTILPYQPFVEYENSEQIGEREINDWRLSLVGINGDPDDPEAYYVIGHISYQEFIERLPEHKYDFIDGAYILVEACTKEELKLLLDE